MKIPDIKLKKEYKVLIGVLAGVLYVYFIFVPSLKGALKGFNRIRMIRSEYAATKLDIANMGKMKVRLDELKKSTDDFESRLVREENINYLLGELSKMAVSSNVKIISIIPQKPEGELFAAYGRIPLSIELKGGYHSLAMFINRLEFANYFMSVEDIKIEADPQDALRHDCKLLVYAYTARKK
ncbi:MAG: type 4a pilus biogenesis protein PilO [Candidatus Omnitrophota bacterium]